MIWAVWAALAFLLAVLAVGAYTLVRRGLAVWRTFKSFTALLGRGSEAISQRADEAARKAGGSGGASDRLGEATARLSRTFAYARLIAAAAGGTGSAVGAWRKALPRK